MCLEQLARQSKVVVQKTLSSFRTKDPVRVVVDSETFCRQNRVDLVQDYSIVKVGSEWVVLGPHVSLALNQV